MNSDIEVSIIDHMGSDLSVVNAARVSFNKKSTEFSDKDEKLISFLSRNNHWTPFSHCFASFRIKVPIAIGVQLLKHQIGLSRNEVSRRYIDNNIQFYHPVVWRERAKDKKQGSKNYGILELKKAHVIVEETYKACLVGYNKMLDLGVAPEQARFLLPTGTMTEFVWSGSLYAFARVCNLRIKDDAQYETRLVAKLISDQLIKLFPISWKHLVINTNKKEENIV